MIKRFQPIIKKVITFVKKGLEIAKTISSSGTMSGLKLVQLVITIAYISCVFPILLATVFLFYIVFERKSTISKLSYLGGTFIVLFICLSSFAFALMQGFIFTREIDLVILKVKFILG